MLADIKYRKSQGIKALARAALGAVPLQRNAERKHFAAE
jgi:hypothetical protein